MKKSNVMIALSLSASILVMSSCASMSNTTKGALIGGAGGAAVGAGVGAMANGSKGAIYGAAIGTAVGAGAGAIIGHKMDKQKEELAAIESAKVEEVVDNNGLEALKVTFQGGILFTSGKAILTDEAKASLIPFATSLKNNPQTDVAIYGHTDNTGTDAVNQPLSEKRALAVKDFLVAQGVANKLTAQGLGSTSPIGDNATTEGKKANRRVEINITANAQMFKSAEAEAAKQ